MEDFYTNSYVFVRVAGQILFIFLSFGRSSLGQIIKKPKYIHRGTLRLRSHERTIK